MVRLLLLASLFFFLPLIAPASAAENGQLIKGSSAAVYFLQDGKRSVFPNSNIYHSWYDDFSTVVTVSDQELQTYPLGRNIAYRPGIKLIKIISDPRVYAVGFNGALYPLASESAAITLYGPSWSSRVHDLPDAFFAGYEIKNPLDGSRHPEGSFLRVTSTNTVYLLLEEEGKTVARTVTAAQESSLRVRSSDIIQVSSLDYNLATDEAPISDLAEPVRRSAQTDPDEPAEQLPPEATLTVARESTIASTSIIKSAPSTPVFEFSFTGDAVHTLRVDELNLLFYIDANNGESDFQRGSDTDGVTTRGIEEILSDIVITRKDSGAILAQQSRTNGYDLLRFPLSLSIAPKEKIVLQVNVGTLSIPTPTPRFSVDVPLENIKISSLTADLITVDGAELLNGGTAPKSIATFIEHGTLSLSSTKESDGIRYFGEETTPFTLQMTAADEAIDVRALSIKIEARTDDVLLIDTVRLSFEQNGQTITHDYSAFENNNLFRFNDIGLHLPANESVTVSVHLQLGPYTQTLSNKYVRLAFDRQYFFATAEHSRFFFSGGTFGSSITDRTTIGPLYKVRNSSPKISLASGTPSGAVNRFDTTKILSFSATAQQNSVILNKFAVKVETNDVGREGENNDMLENLANIVAQNATTVYVHDNSTSGRTRRPIEAVTFSVFRPQVGLITDFDNFTSKVGDYGIFHYTLGTSPFQLSKGETRTFDIEINTTTISHELNATLRATLLDRQDFQWDDGSRILADGTYVQSLPLRGGQLSFERLVF